MARSTQAATAHKALDKQAEQQAASRARTKSRQDKPTLAVRVSHHTNERLTHANEETGLGISGIVEAALTDYLEFLGINRRPAHRRLPEHRRRPAGHRRNRAQGVAAQARHPAPPTHARHLNPTRSTVGGGMLTPDL
ncbi:hypothetical protein FE391_29945 [Nonomuraea sp. KC401]|uniref:hypothetical protein n=1 Tax=unclassified Nonomuraea TaxID=2593643 RepID=UPI0010FCFEED|nr:MULTISPECIES: hypothetical protein [unclassified Nonomuraea]NBE97512.1 hypothetical protein [Nonomuraea sp. K271]TLF62632.1 hypothetical protein FE391_29945 [Nonomuraea sp. KC401]